MNPKLVVLAAAILAAVSFGTVALLDASQNSPHPSAGHANLRTNVSDYPTFIGAPIICSSPDGTALERAFSATVSTVGTEKNATGSPAKGDYTIALATQYLEEARELAQSCLYTEALTAARSALWSYRQVQSNAEPRNVSVDELFTEWEHLWNEAHRRAELLDAWQANATRSNVNLVVYSQILLVDLLRIEVSYNISKERILSTDPSDLRWERTRQGLVGDINMLRTQLEILDAVMGQVPEGGEERIDTAKAKDLALRLANNAREQGARLVPSGTRGETAGTPYYIAKQRHPALMRMCEARAWYGCVVELAIDISAYVATHEDLQRSILPQAEAFNATIASAREVAWADGGAAALRAWGFVEHAHRWNEGQPDRLLLAYHMARTLTARTAFLTEVAPRGS